MALAKVGNTSAGKMNKKMAKVQSTDAVAHAFLFKRT